LFPECKWIKNFLFYFGISIFVISTFRFHLTFYFKKKSIFFSSSFTVWQEKRVGMYLARSGPNEISWPSFGIFRVFDPRVCVCFCF
jgi:hypothetical protein